jgi:glycerophosphoryl diester phosphodiesterase
MAEMGTMQQINSEPLRAATVLTPQSQAEQYAREAQQAAAQAAQSATDAQTAAASAEQAVAGAVKYSEAQTLTSAQQAQARENIGAGDAEEVAELKSAIDNQIEVTKSLYTNTKTTYVPDFVQGRIDSHTDPAVIVSNDTTRVITKDIFNFIAYDNIEITAADGYRFAVWRYTGESESDYASNTGWQTSYKPASLGIRCLRIFVKKTDSSRITPDEAKKNITVTVYGHSIPNNFENISFQNVIRNWADALTISGRVDDTHGSSDSGYRMSPQIRCVPGDRILGTSAGINNLRIFVVYDRFGNISHEIRGTGVNNKINIDYTFTDDDYYFVIVCNANVLSGYSINYISKYDFPILSTGEIAKSTITLDSFDFDFEIGGLNAAQTPPWWTATPITRIRNMRERPFLLKKGDSIYLTDYSDAKMYVVWHNPSDDTWGNRGWIISGAFSVSIDGEYWVLLANITEVTITDISSLSSLLRVEKHGDYHGYVDDAIIPAQRTDWIIKSINHRGYGRLAPENTIPAYALSAKLGWKYVETDVRFTSDGVAVLLHDESINRTARNADGTEIGETINIADITYEQALTYDFGIWKGEPYRGTKIPTLAEFVQFCKNASLDMYLEIKVESGTSVAEAVSIVRRGGMLKHATWIAFSYTALQKVSVVNPDARLGLLGTSITSSIIDILNTLKNDTNDVFLNCAVNGVNSEGCDLIAESGFPLEVYTTNGVATIAALDPYITGVTSDYVNAGLAMFNESIK